MHLSQKQETEFDRLRDKIVLDSEVDLTKPYFKEKHGVLIRVCRPTNAPANDSEVREQIVVPRKYRDKILEYSHYATKFLNTLITQLGICGCYSI